jgi:8-oxo-dGTP pyrophosphatase MutT (NUDIX family)
MNDVSGAAAKIPAHKTITRPRDAASLILLRGAGDDIEVLVGRRPLSVRFMPGAWVFPGGAIDRGDRLAWTVEAGAASLGPRLAPAARAALRETWEEVGVLFGRKADLPHGAASAAAIERAYAEQGLVPALDLLTYVGRAITPSYSHRRFNTRFFLGDGGAVFGMPQISDELEEVRWHRVAEEPCEPFRDVTRFMLTRAVALYRGTAEGAPPLFYWAKNARRIGICREAADLR